MSGAARQCSEEQIISKSKIKIILSSSPIQSALLLLLLAAAAVGGWGSFLSFLVPAGALYLRGCCAHEEPPAQTKFENQSRLEIFDPNDGIVLEIRKTCPTRP